MKSRKPSFFKASRYLLIALPLLFLAPVIFTIGLKALKLDGKYALLILGSLLALAAIIITAVGVIKLTNYIFDRDK